MEEAVIVSAVRTPIGAFGGSLSTIPSTTLGGVVIEEAINQAGIKPSEVDEVLMGNILSAGAGMNPARQAAIKGGIPVNVPAMTVNKMCGSGLKTVALAAQAIRCGDAETVIAGGMESMSQAPFLLPRARWGYRMGHGEVLDSMINDGLFCNMADCHMGVTAETLANMYEVSRDDMDVFAYQSQSKAKSATEAGLFSQEIVPVNIPQPKGDPLSVTQDEHPRPDTTLEKLSRLKPAFAKSGTVTPGNSSGINDGAAAVVVMSTRQAQKLDVKPIAIIRSYSTSGVEPHLMGIGPTSASKKALRKGKLKLENMDLVELNEAFAAQALAVGKELDLDWNRTNVNGGAIALGHPIGASGARILTTLLHEMKRRQSHYGLATLCIGGGMGIAMVVERA